MSAIHSKLAMYDVHGRGPRDATARKEKVRLLKTRVVFANKSGFIIKLSVGDHPSLRTSGPARFME